MKQDYQKVVNQLTSRDIYSVDTRGKPTTVDMYYNHIGKVLSISNRKDSNFSSLNFLLVSMYGNPDFLQYLTILSVRLSNKTALVFVFDLRLPLLVNKLI